MILKWTKGAFLILIGMMFLMYGSGVIEDLEANATGKWGMSFEWTWELLGYLMWILIAWLFVYAALTIVLSFKMDAYTLGDVMNRLRSIESRLEPVADREAKEEVEMEEPETEPVEQGVPPPPGE